MIMTQLGMVAGWLAGAVLVVERLMHGAGEPVAVVFAVLYAWGTVALVVAHKRLGKLESAAEDVGVRSQRLEAALRACGIDPGSV
jgi:hypothetical protein